MTEFTLNPILVSGRKKSEQLSSKKYRKRKKHHMLIILLLFALMPVLIFIELTIQRRLFKNAAAERDAEWELYRQRWD